MNRLLLLLLLAGCAADDPTDTPISEGEGECSPQTPIRGEGPAQAPCDAVDDDYPGQTWDACVSDDGEWVLAGEETPSSAARVAAYEAIGDLLWRNPCVPGSEDFIAAQGIYGEDGGVGSRVTKRYDAHLTPPQDADCKADDAGERWPDYCVGPARIEPLILDAFEAGIAGEDPSGNAAKVRAGLLWFYWVSTYKEAFTCATTQRDCDSSWAYYTGAKQLEDAQLGLAGEIAQAHPQVHESVFTALLGLRCWRGLDPDATATDDALHQRALAQLDRALNRAWEVLAVQGAVPQVTGACD